MYVSMKEMLQRANRENYAVMAINCFNLETARTVIRAAEAERAPVIVNVFWEHFRDHFDSSLSAPLVRTLAEQSPYPVALNLDHGQELSQLYQAVDDGFSSVMADQSRFPLRENIANTKKITEYAHARGVSVEGEIGSLGATEGGEMTGREMYTDPVQAKKFYEETGIDALAVSIGTSHGNYPEGMVPAFDFERLEEIKRLTHAPLVLHGGSGSGAENIQKSVERGINKINVGCDFMNACVEATASILTRQPHINYYDLICQVEEQSQNTVRQYIRLSGSAQKGEE